MYQVAVLEIGVFMSQISALSSYSAFELVKQHHIASRQITVQQYRHKVTSAVHYHLATDSDELAFLVAFRTQPMNSKGAAHILEHTVLCGSEKYPVRDPFFSMMRRSLSTFMNAMTYSDWTAYPFATQNTQDFQNLLSVYLDAVFAPNIHPLDFAQEGIRVELEDGQPVFKGVVFNEMKGALSAPSAQLYYSLMANLFSESTYHYNSGGDPADIPDLSYAELKDFYQTHYHPSNAVFMSFGRQDVNALHQQIEEQALVKFQAGKALSSQIEPNRIAPKTVVESYPVDHDDLKDKTFHALSWLLPSIDDIQLWFGFKLIGGVLLENSSSPLSHYLESCGYAQSSGPILGLNDQNLQMLFTCGVQGSNPEFAEKFQTDVLDILKQVASQPLEKELIDALLHQIEFYQREINAGGMPYGLNLMFEGLNLSIHHRDPIHMWDIDEALQQVKQHIEDDPMWISQLIQTHLIDNPHRILLTLVPDRQKSQDMKQAEQQRLNQIAENMSVEDQQQLELHAQQLKQRQATADDHDILPKLTLGDIPETVHIANGERQQLRIGEQDYPLHVYPAGTNGIYYQQVLIDIPESVLASPYLQIYTLLFGQVGAGTLDYMQLQERQTAVSGGQWMNSSLRSKIDDKSKISRYLILNTKALVTKTEAIDLLKLTFEQIRFDEKSRIMELLTHHKVQWQSNILENGHHFAMQNASRAMSALAQKNEENHGLAAFNHFQELLNDISTHEHSYDAFIAELQQLHQQLCHAKKQFLLVCETSQIDPLKQSIATAWQTFQAPTHARDEIQVANSQNYSNEDQAWLTESNVQYCTQAYPAVSIGHEDAAVFFVLAPYLKNEFLHQAIREQGGAYGGGANFDANSHSFRLFSFRDPRLEETYADFNQSITWLMQQAPDAQKLESAILTTIAGMDKPDSPAGEAISACHASLHEHTPALRQKLRQQILNVNHQDLQRVAQQYLTQDKAQRSVVAPFSKAEQVQKLGFVVKHIS